MLNWWLKLYFGGNSLVFVNEDNVHTFILNSFSVKFVIACNDDRTSPFCDSDVTKLVDFVVPCLSPEYLKSVNGDVRVFDVHVLINCRI
jgi:hypothetical protein